MFRKTMFSVVGLFTLGALTAAFAADTPNRFSLKKVPAKTDTAWKVNPPPGAILMVNALAQNAPGPFAFRFTVWGCDWVFSPIDGKFHREGELKEQIPNPAGWDVRPIGWVEEEKAITGNTTITVRKEFDPKRKLIKTRTTTRTVIREMPDGGFLGSITVSETDATGMRQTAWIERTQ